MAQPNYKLSDVLQSIQNSQIRVALEQMMAIAGIGLNDRVDDDIEKDITGDVVGDVTGDVTGDVVGSISGGDLGGARPRVEVTATGSLTEANMENTVITNYGMASGGDTTLPAIAATVTCTIVTEVASQAWSFKPPSGEAFVLDGTALDADDEIDVGQVAGDMAQLIRIRTGASSYQWHYLSSVGTHSDGGAS